MIVKNTKFNDHLKESLFRDLGNLSKAEARFQQIKSEQQEKNCANDFFKMIDDKNEKKRIFE